MFQRNWKGGIRLAQGAEGQRGIALTVGLLLILALIVSWKDALKPDLLFVMRAIFTVGWWIAFCGKRPSSTASEKHHRLVQIGVLLVLAGAVLQLAVVLYRW